MPGPRWWPSALVLTLALPLLGVEADPTWSIVSSPQARITTIAGGLNLHEGRIALTVPQGGAPCLLHCHPYVIDIHAAIVLVERSGSSFFVSVLAGSAMIRDQDPDRRDLLLMPQQGVGGGGDGQMGDILTFARLPRLDDPLPLARQVDLPADGQAWPTEVPIHVEPLLAATAGTVEEPPVSLPAIVPPASVAAFSGARQPDSIGDSLPIFQPQRLAPSIAASDSAARRLPDPPPGTRGREPAPLPAWLDRGRL